MASTNGSSSTEIPLSPHHEHLEVPGEGWNAKYKRLKKIDSGGFGTVYRAVDLRTNIEVALKFSDRDQLRRFKREIDVLMLVDHENVIRFLDAGEDWYAMHLAEANRERSPHADLVDTPGEVRAPPPKAPDSESSDAPF